MMAAKKRVYWEKDNLETGEPEPIEEYPTENRVVAGSVWMFFVTMVLFFLPIVNGLVGGVVGGYRVGSPRNALMSALGPIFLASCFLWMLYTLVPIPVVVTPLTQIGTAALIALSDLALLVGAGMGGAIAQSRTNRPSHA